MEDIIIDINECLSEVPIVEDPTPSFPLETSPKRLLLKYHYTESPVLHDLSKKSGCQVDATKNSSR